MTKPTSTPIKKTYTPKRTITSMQTSFILGILRSKGYTSQEYMLMLVTVLSTAKNLSDISFDEAQYLITRLPRITKDQLNSFVAGSVTQTEIGLSPYRTQQTFGNRYK